MNDVEREAVRLTSVLKASENWAARYSQAPEQHADLIKNAAQMQVLLVKYYHEMGKKASDFINHYQYLAQLNTKNKATMDREQLAYDVDVIVNDSQIDEWDDTFIKITLKPVTGMITAGAQAGQVIYRIPLGIESTDAIIQNLGTKEVANLVGKRVLKDGTIIDNPNAKYNVNETVRKDIAESVKTSLALGETTDEAISRMQQIIDNPARAERIANTEAVNAYNVGINEFGDQSGAVGEEWDDSGATDICAEYAAQDPQPFGTGWDGLDGPPAHPNCMCVKRLIYQEEWDNEGYGDN